MYDERTKTETKLTALETAAQPDNDPALLDTLPIAAAAVLVGAPDRIKEALLAAFGGVFTGGAVAIFASRCGRGRPIVR